MITEDLDAYFIDFGEAFTLQGGAAGGVTAIFDNAYLEAVGIGGTNPIALTKASSVAAGDIGKTFTRVSGGTVWVIAGREPQDDGSFVLLQLNAQ